MLAEEHRGIEQGKRLPIVNLKIPGIRPRVYVRHADSRSELTICLNRGPEYATNREWLENAFSELSNRLKKDDTSMIFTIWWGHKDPIVPRRSQRKLFIHPSLLPLSRDRVLIA